MSEKYSSPQLESKDHYAYVTRSAIRLFNKGVLTHVTDIDVEPEYGYTTRLSYDDGTYRVTYGNDLGLNPGASNELAKDKGHTKFMLRQIGVNCPEGKEFLLPWWSEQIAESQRAKGHTDLRSTDEALDYLSEEIGYPAYLKPVSGSKGLGVFRVETPQEAEQVFASYDESRVRVAVVEKAVTMPDYRVVVLDGELISAYERKPLSVVGNGDSTVGELLHDLQSSYLAEGRDTIIDSSDPRILQKLGKQGLSLVTKLAHGEELVLTSVSNLSAGGTSVDVSDKLHPHWADTAAYIARNFNLRLCGVDLACTDITKPTANYSVLEVNSTPGLDHYASSGAAQQEIVDALYTKVLNTYPTNYQQN